MSSYIPKSEAEQILWLLNAATWLTANGAAHGFTPAEITAFSTVVGGASMSLTNNVTAQAAAKAATAAKNTALGTAIAQARDNAQRLQNNPNMTDEERAAAGLTIRDETPTSTPADDVMTIDPPLLKLEFNIRRQVTAHWGPNPSNERENGRPDGTIGCQVQYARGGIPTDESQWIALDVDTDSPILHVVDDTTPTTYAYRARYVGKNVKFGPFGDPVVCTVSV